MIAVLWAPANRGAFTSGTGEWYGRDARLLFGVLCRAIDTGHVHLDFCALHSCDLYCGHIVLPEVPEDELALNVRLISTWGILNPGGQLTVFRYLRKRMHRGRHTNK